MKTTSYLHYILGIVLTGLFACGGNENSKNDSASASSTQASSESKDKESSSSANSGPVSKADLLNWLPLNHAGFTREKEPSADHGDLPRVQVRYVYDDEPEQQFTLDVLDGKGPLVVAVNGMINLNLGEEYDEPLLDGYAKVYVNKGVKAFERHTRRMEKLFCIMPWMRGFTSNLREIKSAQRFFGSFKKFWTLQLFPNER